MVKPMRVGVLALQGDFALHQTMLKRLGAESPAVRSPETLSTCDGLVMPGGESTTLHLLLKKTGLLDAIPDFARTHAIFGTCAGMILIASRITTNGMSTLGLIDLEVERNAYGRQVDSFVDTIRVPHFTGKPFIEGVFIRAPRIRAVGEGTEPLGFHGDEVVMARNRRVLAAAFHPELTRDSRVHRYFLDMVEQVRAT